VLFFPKKSRAVHIRYDSHSYILLQSSKFIVSDKNKSLCLIGLILVLGLLH